MSLVAVPSEAFEAQEWLHGQEIAKLRMQLVTYRAALEEAGIEPPDMEGADLLQMWRDCRKVIETANEFVIGLGTSKELLGSWVSR